MTDPFFDIRNKQALLACPPDSDPVTWSAYIDRQTQAEQLKQSGSGPIQIDIELNGSCNMACPFCIHGTGEARTKSKLSWEQFTNLIDEAVEIGVASLKLNYINEPLLSPLIYDAINYAKKSGILNVYFTTNGSLLVPSVREQLLSSGLTKLFVSIDAAKASTYNKQRRNGAYDAVVHNVKSFIQERDALGKQYPLVRVSFLKNSINEGEADMFYEQWSSVADVVTFQTMNEVPGHSTGLTIKRSERPSPCSFPFKQLVIDSEGDILPCCKLYGKHLPLGNIDSSSLQDAWDSPTMKNIQNAHMTDTWDQIPACNACLYNDAA